MGSGAGYAAHGPNQANSGLTVQVAPAGLQPVGQGVQAKPVSLVVLAQPAPQEHLPDLATGTHRESPQSQGMAGGSGSTEWKPLAWSLPISF